FLLALSRLAAEGFEAALALGEPLSRLEKLPKRQQEAPELRLPRGLAFDLARPSEQGRSFVDRAPHLGLLLDEPRPSGPVDLQGCQCLAPARQLFEPLLSLLDLPLERLELALVNRFETLELPAVRVGLGAGRFRPLVGSLPKTF